MLVVTAIIQLAVWNAPQDIRWDGTLREWPIPWIVCCGSLGGFVAVFAAYVVAWITFIAVALGFRTRKLFFDFALLLAFPALVYVYMYWHYFGFRG
tara:strand:- start:212 stop:499 length:288 start_codon:yes stop_codon:yes gene_type:complete